MASLNTILQWFKKGLIPTEAQFTAAWSSFRHKEDSIPFSEVEGLTEAFENTVGLEIIDNVTADLNTRAKADASNIDVLQWKTALEITNIATVDGDNPDGNVYNKTQIDEIVTTLHERDDTNAQLIDDIKNTLLSNDINLDELQEVVNYIKENRQDIEDLQAVVIGQTTDDKINLQDNYTELGSPSTQQELNLAVYSAIQALQTSSDDAIVTITTSSNIAHTLGTDKLIVQVRDSVTGKSMLCEDYATSTHVQINFLDDVQNPCNVLIKRVNA